MRSYRLLLVFIGALTVTNCPGQYHPISSGDFTGCSGIFVDSGHTTGDYGPNENFTITICPDGSTGTHTKLAFSGVQIPFGDELCFFDGPTTFAPSLGCASSFLPGAPFIIQATPMNIGGCITVTFNSNNSGQGKGWMAAISCVPACQAFNATILTSDPLPSPADTGWIDICPGETVSFNGALEFFQNNILYNQVDSLCVFEWDFGDGNLKTGFLVENEYKYPGGYKVTLSVADQFGCKNTNVFSQRVRVAPHPSITIANLPGPLCMNDTISLSADDLANGGHNISIVPQEARFELTKIRADSLPLPDGNGALYQTSVLFTEFPPDKTLTDPAQILSICANMEHSWMRDLRITLTCPSGQSVVLVNQEETGEEVFLGNPFENDELLPEPIPGDGFTYCWNVNAPNGTWLEYANQYMPQILPENSYKSFESLDNLLGCPLNGEWILSIQDLWAIDNGFIFWWNITFDETLLPNLETFTPVITDLSWKNQPNIFLYKDQDIQAYADQAGETFFQLTYTDNFNCTSDTFVTIPVLPLTHPSCLDCNQLITVSPDTAVCENGIVELHSQVTGFEGGTIPFSHYPMATLGYSTNPPSNPYRAPIQVTNIYPDILMDASVMIESVCFNLKTNPVNNIAVYLEAPDGKMLELTSYNGGLGIDFINTCFTPTILQPIQGGSAPFTGSYQPEGNWSILDGAPVNGTWNLVVTDNFGLNRLGLLENWSISFKATNAFDYSWDPPISVSCPDCPSTEVVTDQTRTYQLEVNDRYGCQALREVDVTIHPIYPAPIVNCGPSTSNYLEINWAAVPNAPGYEININQSGWIPVNGNLQHFISGLVNGEYVNVQLRVTSSSPECMSQITTIDCRYLYCQMYAVVEDSIAPSCFGGNDGEAFVSAYNGTSPFSYNLDNLKIQPVGYFNAVNAGNHFVIVTDNLGCMDTVFFSLSQPDAIDITMVIDSVSCYGGNDGSVATSSTGGTGNHNYLWFTVPAVFSPNLLNRSSGTFMLRVTDQNNCIKDTSIFIGQPDPLSLSFITDSISCPGNMDGQSIVQPAGGTMPYSYLWSNGQSSSQIMNLGMGIYSVTATDKNGCTITGSTVIGERPANSYQVFTQAPTCYKGSDGKAWISVILAPEPVAYYWQDPNAQLSDTAIGLQAGNLRLIIEDFLGCRDTLTMVVPEQDSILLLMTASMATCPGSLDGSTNVQVLSGGSAPFTYLWNDPNNQQSATATGLAYGNYQVTVSDSNGCTQIGSAFIDMADGVNMSLTASPASCQSSLDGSATLVVSGGAWPYTYLWNDPQGTTDSILLNVNPGWYTVTITTFQGCVSTDSILVGVINDIKIDSISTIQPSCTGDNNGSLEVHISGGMAPYSFNWSDGSNQITNPAIGLFAGNYTVTVTDDLGCTISGTFPLLDPLPLLITMVPTNVTCPGLATGSLNAITSGGTPPYSFVWNTMPLQTGQQAIALPAGVYMVTVSDANGCSSIQSGIIAEPASPLTVQLSQTKQGCAGEQDNSITGIASGGTGPGYLFNWSNTGTTSQLDDLAPGQYTVTVTDLAGCSVISQINIDDLLPVSISLSGIEPSCHGISDGSLSVIQIVGGVGMDILSNYELIWNTSPPQMGQVISGLKGETSYAVTATDAIGCTGTSTFHLGEPNAIQPEIIITPVQCLGDKNGAAEIINITGGNGNYSLQWDNSSGGGSQWIVNNLGEGSYTVTITDGQGCMMDTSIYISEPLAMQIDIIQQNDISCFGGLNGFIQVGTSGGTGTITYQWNTNDTTPLIRNLSAGSYQVTATDMRGCTGIRNISLNQPNQLELSLIGDPPNCTGKTDGSIEAIPSGGTEPYLFALNNQSYSPSGVFGPLLAGSYTVGVEDANGCTLTEMIVLEDPSDFEVDAGEDITIELGESIQLSASTTLTQQPQFTWFAPYAGTLSCTNCPDPIASPNYTITYTVNVVDDNGCESSDQIKVFVIYDRTVLVPTAFTPNGDGNNDKMLIHGKEGSRIIIFRVFDRWGEKLYEMENFMINDPIIGWDGTYRGSNLNPGVYIWSLEVEFEDGFRQIFSGQTTLLR